MNLAANLNSIREKIFFICLLLVVAFFPFSEALVSISSALLAIQAIILRSWNHPSVKQRNPLFLILIASVFAVYLTGMIFTEDLPFAFYELKKVTFWIVLPAAIFFSPRLNRNQFLIILLLFCLGVLLSSFLGIFRLIFKDYFCINDFRDIIIISHIRFSFQLLLSVIIVVCFLVYHTRLPFLGRTPSLLYLYLLWSVFFLLLLKSMTGIAAFIGTAFIAFVFFVTKIRSRLKRIFVLISAFLVIALPVAYVAGVVYDFYHIEKLDPDKVDWYTPSGNLYSFDFSSLEKENGHWVRAYICDTELRKEWNNISRCKYDSIDPYGYPYSATLIRYMTSKGLRKDSAGVCMLTREDVKAIEASVANHIYAGSSFSVYPRVYETIWELDNYYRTGDPNHQSVSQRIEYIKASFRLIKENPVFGIGTGNWKIRYAETYREMNSPLTPENQGPSHNQYLNYLVKFGLAGFIFILSVLLIPVFMEGHKRNLLFWFFLISIAIANLGDANLETHMGLSFFCFFYGLFLWNTPPEFRDLPSS